LHRKLIATAIAAAAALIAATPAGAVIIPLQYDHVVLDTPATPNGEVVSSSTPPLKVNADVNPGTGDFTVQPADFDFPEYSFSTPVNGTIDIFLHDPASGKVNFATGQVSFTGTFDAKITVTGVGDCTKTVGPLTLTTETQDPLPGSPFPPGASGPVTGNGAFGAGWETLAPGTGPGCGIIDSFTTGKGGIWISRGIDPKVYTNPGAPKLGLKAKKPKAVKRGHKRTVKAVVSNSGDGDATKVKVCLHTQKGLRPRNRCRNVGTLAAGKSKTVRIRVKAPKHRTGRFSLKWKATASGIKAARASTKLRVHR
jgi:hypothetical protein